jgi:GntR family transcriptional repressor for pyruvate dehydrogenase complex
MLQIQRPHDTAQMISQQILDLVHQGALKPGDRLPAETELMAHYGVGRSSVREAKRVLAAKGVISPQVGRGTFIRTIGSEVFDGELLRVLLRQETLLELQETRDLLEVQVVTLATQRATNEDLRLMESWLARMREDAPSPAIHAYSVEFHRSLALATHNRVLIQLYQVIEGLLSDYLQPLYMQYGDPLHEVDDHWILFSAVRGRDVERARQLMQEHMSQVRNFLTRVLSPTEALV